MDLGKRLRQLRERRGFSIYEVERRARLHFSTISKYERNERQPSIDVLQELAGVYGVPLASIFAEDADLRQFLAAEELEWLNWLRGDRRLVELLEVARVLPASRLEALLVFLRPDGPSGRDAAYPGHPPARAGRTGRQSDSGT
ncbi:MAG TPA: helix-turn-helix transcriptional regulator [Bacillota bacterium]